MIERPDRRQRNAVVHRRDTEHRQRAGDVDDQPHPLAERGAGDRRHEHAEHGDDRECEHMRPSTQQWLDHCRIHGIDGIHATTINRYVRAFSYARPARMADRMSTSDNETGQPTGSGLDIVRDLVTADIEAGTFGGRVQTRFPPEPNGYLHIGHAKAIIIDFGIAAEFGGVCNLRYDDTNPDTEDIEFAGSIIDDLTWLGFPPGEPLYASDYFEHLYLWAEYLVSKGLAYVDDQDGETISAQRGGYGKPGVESPYRDRPVDENLDLLRRMRAGEFADGSRVLRAKIDMQHENMQLRDPVMYRIRRGHHWRTGDDWVIYPTYDWAHGQSDAIEGVTHSLCTLEFDSHRALYDWYLDHLPLPGDQPRQTEFARLEFTHTITSKRRLARLVADGVVDGWDDPRMPTLRGVRRRGYPPSAIRAFCNFIGVARTNSRHSIELLESFIRRELNETSLRRMAVLRPLEAGDHQLARRRRRQSRRRASRGRQQSGERRRRHRAGCRSRRCCTSSTTTSWRTLPEVLPSDARPRGATAIRVLRDVHRLR